MVKNKFLKELFKLWECKPRESADLRIFHKTNKYRIIRENFPNKIGAKGVEFYITENRHVGKDIALIIWNELNLHKPKKDGEK